MDNRTNYTEWKEYKGTWYRRALQYESSFMEKQLQKEFVAKKVRYIREVQFKGLTTPYGGWYRADFYLPDKDMIVEYDGLHHLTDSQKSIDKLKDNYYKSIGLKVIRVNKNNFTEALKEIYGVKKKKTRKSNNKLDQRQLGLLLKEALVLAKPNCSIQSYIQIVKEINNNK